MNRNCIIKEVQFSCDKTCSDQINFIIEELRVKMPLLDENQCSLIDNQLDGVTLTEAEANEADRLLKKSIMGIFRNALPAIVALQQAPRATGKKQSNWDSMLTIIISLTNLADQMPPIYYNELFVEIEKIVEVLNSRAALKLCSTLFSIVFYSHKQNKLIYDNQDPEDEDVRDHRDYERSGPLLKENLLKLYKIWLQVAGGAKCLNEVPHTIEDIQLFITEWNLTDTKEEADIWKALWVQLKNLTSQGKAVFATNVAIDRTSALVLTEKVMLRMLNAASRVYEISEQEELAKLCILHALRDKHCYLYDSLLMTKCVQLLNGSPSYQLLEIFAKGILPEFREYMATDAGAEFLKELAKAEAERLKNTNKVIDEKMIHSFLERKIRQLTFIELANECIRSKRYNNGEPNMEASLSIDQLKEQLDLKDDLTVEEFIIDAIRTNMVKAKLSQMDRKVIIHHAVPRQFSRDHWVGLFNRLNNWREQIARVSNGFDEIINRVAPEVFRNSIGWFYKTTPTL